MDFYKFIYRKSCFWFINKRYFNVIYLIDKYFRTKPNAFGSKCELSKKFIKDILSCGIIETIVEEVLNIYNNKFRLYRNKTVN